MLALNFTAVEPLSALSWRVFGLIVRSPPIPHRSQRRPQPDPSRCGCPSHPPLTHPIPHPHAHAPSAPRGWWTTCCPTTSGHAQCCSRLRRWPLWVRRRGRREGDTGVGAGGGAGGRGAWGARGVGGPARHESDPIHTPGLSLTVPLAMLSDLLLHGVRRRLLAILSPPRLTCPTPSPARGPVRPLHHLRRRRVARHRRVRGRQHGRPARAALQGGETAARALLAPNGVAVRPERGAGRRVDKLIALYKCPLGSPRATGSITTLFSGPTWWEPS